MATHGRHLGYYSVSNLKSKIPRRYHNKQSVKDLEEDLDLQLSMLDDMEDSDSSESDTQQHFSEHSSANSKRNKKITRSANHLLNFHYPSPLPQKKRSIQSLAFKRERYLQANYRFIVTPGDYSQNLADPDTVIEWECIEQVICPVSSDYDCVICLQKPICAKIARCGHVTCWSCMIRYFSYADGKTSMPCPVCLKERVQLQDLKSVLFVHVPNYSIGDVIEMVLVHRLKCSTAISVCSRSEENKLQITSFTEGYGLPTWGDANSAYNRINLTFDIMPLIEQEGKELDEAIREADSNSDDSLPFLLEARDYLAGKTVAVEKIQHKFETQVGLPPTNMNYSQPNESDSYFFFQEISGQLIFLHPINVRWLTQEYGSHSKFPLKLSCKILDFEEVSQTEQTRKRYKYLDYLPISCGFKFCLVEMDSTLLPTASNLKGFQQDVQHRAIRLQREAEEQERQLARSQAAAQAEALASQQLVRAYLVNTRPVNTEPLDLTSTEAFPAVSQTQPSHTENASSTPTSPQRNIRNEWRAGPPTPIEQFPSLSAAASAQRPTPSGDWSSPLRANTSSAATPKRPAPQGSPNNNSKTKGKKRVLLSTDMLMHK